MSRWKERGDFLKTILGFYNGRDWKNVKVRFIVSTGRTGTKFLAKFFDSFSSTINARHEPNPDFLKLGINYARGKVSFDKACATIKKSRLWICNEIDKNNVKIYIESNNRYFSLIPVLWKIFPDAKIVHIIRDGRDYVRSVMNRDHYTVKDGIYYKKKLRLQAIDFPDDFYYDKWNKMSQFEKCCWQWVKRDSFIYKEVKHDGRAITVKFEDIFDKNKDYTGLWKIVNFMQLDISKEKFIEKCNKFMDNKINRNKTYIFPHWKEWSKKQRQQFINIAGKHMELYGW